MGEQARGKAFVQVLSCVLSRLVSANDAVSQGRQSQRVSPGPALASRSAHSPPQALFRLHHLRLLLCTCSSRVQVADPGPVTKFHALRPPSISIYDYCAR